MTTIKMHEYFGCTESGLWHVGNVYHRDLQALLKLLKLMVDETKFVPPDTHKAIEEIEAYIEEIVNQFCVQVSGTLYPTDTLEAWSHRFPWLADDFDELWQTIQTTETAIEHEQNTEDTT